MALYCFQDEENIVPSWELRVEGRLLEEVIFMAITVTMLLLYTVVFSLTTTDADIMRGSPKNSNVYVKEFRHRSITSFD